MNRAELVFHESSDGSVGFKDQKKASRGSGGRPAVGGGVSSS